MRGESFGGITFLHNIKPSSFGGTKKLYWRRVLGGFGGFIYRELLQCSQETDFFEKVNFNFNV